MNDNKKPLHERIAKAIKGGDSTGLDPEIIREMAKLLDETGLTEIEVEQAGLRVRVVRALAPQTIAVPMAGAVPAQGPFTAPHAGHATETAAPEPARRQGTVVTSPMVGTVYLAPQPGATPFVKVGDSVTDGTLCIIEAMKTMNPVPSPAAGRVAEIYVHDGQPVEFGEPLMLIE
jgi:acetyl-CoA carboxylase biotin carboxyl carrier protein